MKQIAGELIVALVNELMTSLGLLKHQEDAGQFPDQAMLKRWGHDIEILTDSIIRTCYPVDYLKRQVAAEDQQFLGADPLLREAISCLSHYGSGGRYHDLNIIRERKPSGESPESAWQRLEMPLSRAT